MGEPALRREEGPALQSRLTKARQVFMMPDVETLQLVGMKFLFAVLMVGAVMTMAGYSVLAERKVSAWMQGRVGPNRTVLPYVQSLSLIHI